MLVPFMKNGPWSNKLVDSSTVSFNRDKKTWIINNILELLKKNYVSICFSKTFYLFFNGKSFF